MQIRMGWLRAMHARRVLTDFFSWVPSRNRVRLMRHEQFEHETVRMRRFRGHCVSGGLYWARTISAHQPKAL